MSAPLRSTASGNVKFIEDQKVSSTFLCNTPSPFNIDHDISSPHRLHLLLVDQNIQVRKACCEIAECAELLVTETGNCEVARQFLKEKKISILLLDVTDHEKGSLTLLEEMKALYPDVPVVVMSARASIEAAVDMMRMGACDYLSKPFPLNVLTDALTRAASRWHFATERRRLEENVRSEAGMVDALGKTVEMEKLYRILSSVTNSKHPVMILGEGGTGKSLVAQSIHDNGPHSAKPFTSLDCTLLGPDMLERVLFGEAIKKSGDRDYGLLASRRGGTIFLDEIDSLSLELQGKLVKAISENESRKGESMAGTRISVRVVAATSRDLTQMVKEGLFRMDLFRLLSVVNLKIPPLRDRPDDIAFLAKRFLAKIQHETGLTRTLSRETLDMLETYDWPDNIRELESTLTAACSHSPSGEVVPNHLPRKLLHFHRKTKSPSGTGDVTTDPLDEFPEHQAILPISKVEERAILEAIRQTRGDKLMAAELLGIGKTTLYRKLKGYGYSEEANVDSTFIPPAATPPVHHICA